MNKLEKSILVCSILLVMVTPAAGHHSAAAFNTQEDITVTGTVTDWSFRNPHVYLTLDVVQEDGSIAEVRVEAGAGSVINALGVTAESVSEGDVVTIAGNPGRRNPTELMLGRELYKQDGSYYPLNISSRSIYAESDEKASSINGTWFSPRTSFFGFLGSSRSWPVTDAGTEAMANSNPLETTQKDCIPIGAPGLMFYPVASTVDIQDDRVILTIDWLDSVRTVYLDGRAHPPASETSLHGHSTGRWEGDTLIIDTTNFSAHLMGLSTSLPSSSQKHLIERLAVSEDGTQMNYSGVMEDPIYLTEAVEWSGNWQYRPNMSHSNQACDIEIARRFLED